MRAKKGKIFLLIPVLLLLFAGIAYLGISFFYSQRFVPGTWINGIYCTGMNVTQANAVLKEQTKIDDFQMTDQEGQIILLSPGVLEMEVDYSSQLEKLMFCQNPFGWIGKLNQNFQETELLPEYFFNESKLEQVISQTDLVAAANARLQDIVILKGEQGYELYNGTTRVLDTEKVVQVAKKALYQGGFAINLAQEGCYKDLELNPKMQETLELFAKIEAFQNVGIVYDMGDSMVEITPALAAEWIMLDENGTFVLDENGELLLRREGIEEFIEGLAREYDTYGGTRVFQATRGETVEITGGTYGNKLDKEAEILYLTDAFLKGMEEVHIPAYEKEAMVRGKNDIGDTYIEIDMTGQKMYYYKNGEKLLETDVVTGCVEKNRETPEGVNFVYYKSRNTILKGKDYESFVKYWMAVKGGIGIHDASWRKKFGGEIYKKNGSHGCINTPESVMKELYNAVEKGTPVVMFY